MRSERFVTVAIVAVVAGALQLAAPTSTAWADAATDQFQANARRVLDNLYRKRPYSCSSFGVSLGKDVYIVDMPPWAAAAGLRRGDRPVAYAGVRLTGIEDSDEELWAKVAKGDKVEIHVERAGKEIPLQIPCRDDFEKWAADVFIGRAIVDGRWQDCVDALSRFVRAAGYTSSRTHNTAILCLREKAKAERQKPPDKYWRGIHAWATKAIEESRYKPSGLTETRVGLLSATEALEKEGRTTLAADIKQQIASFKLATPDTGAREERQTFQRIGTAFAVRPDGYFLTAFHVVKDAKAIEISCPESGKLAALVDKFSEANDLAILRVANGKTPNYLVIADQTTTSLGEPVFTIGYPVPDTLGAEAKFTEGAISSLSVGGDAGYMQISVPVHPGNSGGPLVNNSGDVVGVVIATASALSFLKNTGVLPQNVSWAVKGAFAAPLFDVPQPSPRVPGRAVAIQRAQKATCHLAVSSERPQ